MRVLKVLVLVLLLASVSVFAQTDGQSMGPNETSDLWFVELFSAPAAEVDATFSPQDRANYIQRLRQEKDAFRAAARAAGIQFRERYAFDVLWNGLSIQVSPARLAALWRLPGVSNLYPVAEVRPELFTALNMTGANLVQAPPYGLTGAGIKVAVMDTGVDYNHPDLGGCFGPGCRVATGWDFVGDVFNADPASPTYNPIPAPDPDPDDCNGHGTHVAGIVGANGVVDGVAPGVTFGAYRVFGCDGSTTSDIMIAAMERLLADGMQVLNMSIGSAFQWPQYPTGRASDNLVNKGVVVVASIGNSGANGIYSAGSPGLGQKVIGVASFDNTHVTAFQFEVDGGTPLSVNYLRMSGSPPAPFSGSLLLALTTSAPNPLADACNPLPAGSLAGQAALIQRGTCTFYTKARNAQLAGATAVVIYNNASGIFSGTAAGSPPVTIPVVSISGTQGGAIRSRILAGPTNLTWQATTAQIANATGNTISSFSSYGPSPDLALKPDIGAPGGLIFSTLPLELGGYGVLSGTSMSSPHVAGGIALLLQARPRTNSQVVRDLLQNTATPKPWWRNPALGFLDNTHRQGAGMLNLVAAVESRAKIQPGKLSLGELAGGASVTRRIVVENTGPGTLGLTVGHTPALATGPNTFAPAFFTDAAGVSFSVPSLSVPPGGTANLDITLTAPATLPDRSLFGGYITLYDAALNVTYRVPYGGFKGDYQSIQVLTALTNVFPCLAAAPTPAPPAPLPACLSSLTFNPAGGGLAWLRVHLNHQVRELRFEVFDAASGRAYGRLLDLDYFRRNSTSGNYFEFAWDGKDRRGALVPNGTYVLRVSVRKALGTDSDVEVWTTPPIAVVGSP